MNLVGFLPQRESTGQQLARGINRGISTLSDQYLELAREKELAQAKEKAKSQSLMDMISTFGGGQSGGSAPGQGFDLENLTPTQQAILATQHPEFVATLQKAKKDQAEQQAKVQEDEALAQSFDELDDAIDKSTGYGISTKNWARRIPGTPTYEAEKKLDALGLWLTDRVWTKANKGQVSDKKLKMIKEDLAPRSGLSQAENRQRLKSLKLMAGLPDNISKQKFEAVIDAEKKKIDAKSSDSKSDSKSRPSLDELADEFLY